ncbi:iron-sulfur cluster insertion protein ErpA [Buchnera aphidicola]|uniref:iron-sulfur cluster insertion protein ErpA n=1 Tax=Buchnera aphidicola TaxID=9 RepID=UPI0020936160|nr:iron-sulfur cluster insertion protein ErpA [Buchnera aphidicola]USS94274.1 iron-sulfur cluster insertion protein ErpA [Buchnera aphidicola (Sipha maydis)]WII23824.1 iron-sulfur cluster insertion protein ErpA [Buchnera aphidicola (Sipha maydis)]
MKNFVSQITLTKSAITQIKNLIFYKNKKNIKFRVYITGGGCSGFQYKFKFEKTYKENDIVIKQSHIKIIIDPISLQYLIGGEIDYVEDLNGAKFIVKNPNAKTKCSCGVSFGL